MKKIIKTLLFITFLLYPFSLWASEINYPNANDYKYPEYEVNIINDLKASLNQLKNLEDTIKFIFNYRFDIVSNKSKYYSIEIISLLTNKLYGYGGLNTAEDNQHFLLNNPDVLKFVTEHENYENYENSEIWNKIITWVFLKPTGTEKDLYAERRLNMLKKIIENNKEFAPLISYLLIVVDEFYDQASIYPKKDYEIIQTIIDNYPDTEFAAFAHIDIACLYGRLDKKEKAIQVLDNMFVIYNKNFFLGNSDLFSTAHSLMVRFYCKLDNKEKVSFFLKKINKNIFNIDKFINYYNDKINQ